MATSKTKTTKPETPFEAFTVPTSAMEVPAAFREAAEKSVVQFRDSYDKARVAAEETTALVEDAFETYRDGAKGFGEKAIEAAQSNSEASFAFARQLVSAKTVADVVELQTAFARQQFESATEQFKTFQELGQQFFNDTTKPVAEKFEKTFKDLNAA